MKRKILFKAKRIDNGEWIEGHYVLLRGQQFIFYGAVSKVKIEPETLCQFTGLLDKNGNKVFEGDIITASSYSYDEPLDDFTGEVVLGGVIGIGLLALEEERTGTSNDFVELSEIRGSYTTIYEIIGNIYD